MAGCNPVFSSALGILFFVYNWIVPFVLLGFIILPSCCNKLGCTCWTLIHLNSANTKDFSDVLFS